MNSKILAVSTAAALLVCSSAAFAQDLMTCFGSVALGGSQQLDAKTAFAGRTIKVWAITQQGMKTSNHWLFEKEPIVRKFSATTLTESQGGEQATDEITYEGKGWCRKDAFESRKKCYGVVLLALGAGKFEHREVELRNDGGFCGGYITAKLEGLSDAEPAGQQRAPSRREPRSGD